MRAEPNEHNQERYVDHSFNILLLAFDAVIAGLGALLGLALFGWSGFMTGGAIGLTIGIFLFVAMTRS